MNNTEIFKKALKATLPVLTGYAVLGMGFGILVKASGFDGIVAILMSIFIYAGSMQYAAVGLLTGGASFLTSAITTFMVNARHIFYGISMIDKYKGMGTYKPYLIFSLTDETYSLLCSDDHDVPQEKRKAYYLAVSLLDQCYWVFGTVVGVFLGSVIKFNTEGIDFSLTALFVTIFIDQWLTKKGRVPALIGVGVSVLCLVLFGADRFLIPAMLIISLILCVCKEDKNND